MSALAHAERRQRAVEGAVDCEVSVLTATALIAAVGHAASSAAAAS
jgi:hypothetical protein